MWQSLPEFGTLVLYAVLVTAAYTFAQAVAASSGQHRYLVAARRSAYATSALIGLGVTLLAYAFITHDFRIRYVARYSDRSMSEGYLLAALWGGQDGSLLWWSFLLAIYTAACVYWMRGRFRRLEPLVIATLMTVVGFFAVLMLFAANPFQTSVLGSVPDGEGLNPLLQNYWMIIHPPMLYTGFVGCSVPFAFAVAALASGRLDNEWIVGVRKWMLFAWLALSIGNVLGMVWAYEELGWGGFWAWDPVENASALPWFTATAYLHSRMIQERRNMLKVWNVVLICLTFFLTIFGTFLTRSGLISSVHSFAQSDIGTFFVWFMGIVLAASAGLIVWRLPLLRSDSQVEALLSREAAFVVNNWSLLGLMVFVAGATLFPKLSEWLYRETITVGPPFFNRWAAPIGILLLLLMGLAPLLGWRKTSAKAMRRAFLFPIAVTVTVAVAHVSFGRSLGMPAFVSHDAQSSGLMDTLLRAGSTAAPFLTVALAAFNIAVILQEFYFGIRARRSTSDQRDKRENVFESLVRLVAKNRRRYGGYIVHLGITAMYLGFVGTVWSTTEEVSVAKGDSFEAAGYKVTYVGPRMCPGSPACSNEEQSDTSKRMLFADLDVYRGNQKLARISPAKFIYNRGEGMTTTEVALLRGLRADLYVVLGTADPATQRAQLQVHGNPFVSWIWIGLLVLACGATVSLWPDVSFGRLGVWNIAKASAGVATAAMMALILASSMSSRTVVRIPHRQPSLSEHAPHVLSPIPGAHLP
ncbi:MAG TPA: cytochrome c-type biogenesis CcmF C-terminal domain-containing protein [Polyangiaceae bacterium]|nr:cytochrome c-type biogenesis CcmF C-terminal domain-containing protein [Polyangiaceae bacterium]